MRETRPYADWATEKYARWMDAANTFGRHLRESARDYALEKIPADASDEARAVAGEAVLNALYGVMMVLEGIPRNYIDTDHRIEYVLTARIRDRHQGNTLETVELSPDGDGLCMGYHGWLNDEFE